MLSVTRLQNTLGTCKTLERTQDPAEHHICYCAELKYKSILDEENLYFGLFWLFASSKLKICKIFNFPKKNFRNFDYENISFNGVYDFDMHFVDSAAKNNSKKTSS